jgi:hypothetical protein
MRRVPPRVRVRIHPYVEPEVAKLLREYGRARGLPVSAVIGEALRKHIDRTGDMDLVMRRLDRLSEENALAERDRALLTEALAVMVQLWLGYAPKLGADPKEFARRTPKDRYAQYVQLVGERFANGPRFVDDLPSEVVAEDAELTEDAAPISPSEWDEQVVDPSETIPRPAGGRR